MSKATSVAQALRARFPEVCRFFGFAGRSRHASDTPLKRAVEAVPLPIEGLEPRRHLSCSLSGDELTCDGTSSGETIRVYQNDGNPDTIGVTIGSTVQGSWSGLSKVIINALGGNDTVDVGTASQLGPLGDEGVAVPVDIYGGDGNDLLEGGDFAESMGGGAGADTLSGNGGGDTMRGEDGNDELYGGADGDYIYGGYGGSDYIDGQAGNDSLYGSDAGGSNAENLADTILGGADNDIVWGEGGADWLEGGAGNDFMYGGESDNRDTSNDTIYGDDSLDATTGSDTIHGGQGNDWINPGDGTDTAYGDAGDDTITGSDDGDSDLLDGGSGTADSLGSHGGGDSFSNFELPEDPGP